MSVSQPPGGSRLRGGLGARDAVLAAATSLFLEHGYRDTSTDQIAAAAAVSKQTVYNQFGDKETLFRAVLGSVTTRAGSFVDGLPAAFAEIEGTGDLEPALQGLARRYLSTVTQPPVLALRRLVVAESGRFPELARDYHSAAAGRVLRALAKEFRALAARGLLTVDDPAAVAEDFAFLVLGAPLDHAMFHPGATKARTARADRAVRVFLRSRGL